MSEHRISNAVIERILGIPIADVVGQDVTLKKAGANLKGLCPFHDDRTPSFVVSPAKGICKCFACGKGGNVISYYMEMNGVSYPEAIRALGKAHDIEVPEVEMTDEQKAAQQKVESARVAITAAYGLYREELRRQPEAMRYLTERGITMETADAYGLGATMDNSGLMKALLAQGYSEESIRDAGLICRDEKTGLLRDFFWKRVLFPFMDRRGQVVGFSGRDIGGKSSQKYKNTGETCLFTKGKQVYGFWQARQAIAREDCVYIVEGQFDVLQLHQAGVKNVVAGSGTAFTEAQRKLLHGCTANAVFIYDGDEAGLRAAEKNLPGMVASGFAVKCIRLPEGKDPDDMARQHGAKIGEWLKRQTRGYVEFLTKLLFTEGQTAHERLEAVKRVVAIVAKEREEVVRKQLLGEVAAAANRRPPAGKTGEHTSSETEDVYSLEVLQPYVEEAKVPEGPQKSDPGFYGMEFVEDCIDADEPVVWLTDTLGTWQRHAGAGEPWLYVQGVPPTEAVQELNKRVDHVVVCPAAAEFVGRKESTATRMMRALFTRGMIVDVSTPKDGEMSFPYWYISSYKALIAQGSLTSEVKTEYIQRCAEVISYVRPAVLAVERRPWAEALGLKPSELDAVLKPYLNERKSKKRLDRERSAYAGLVNVDTDRVPDYVEQNEEYQKMLQMFGFYPMIREDGTPVCYMFRTDGGSYRRVGDFYIEPLVHIYAKQKEENKRIIKINRLYVLQPTYVEWPSSVFAKLSTLQEMLINEGAFNFTNGTAADYVKIWNYISYQFQQCYRLKVFGQQPEGYFCFANGIFHQVEDAWRYDAADELGLMRHGDDTLYSPAFSKVNAGLRKDDDRENEQDRWLVYTEVPPSRRITFQKWAALMDEVYQLNDNGKWAVLYAILCAFRSDIWPIGRIFTALFFVGPTMSGKTQVAISIRSLFIRPDAPSFNLNSGSDAAFFSVLERFRDVPQVMEEYNDEMISDVKFQGLKQVIYDGEGKQKRKAATTNDIDSSKVNAPIVLLGQESPQKDDNALSNRVIICEVPKNEAINSEHAKAIFEQLKEAEKTGLSYLLLEVLKLRPLVRQHFAELLKQCKRELQGRVEATSARSGEQARVIETVSLFLAICRLLEEHAPQLQLPFTYEQFLRLATQKVQGQIAMLVQTDKLAAFFKRMDYLIDQGRIVEGRDFKIEQPASITLSGRGERQLRGQRVIYMNLSNIHTMYASSQGSGGERPLTMQTLQVNLRSHSSFLGVVGSTRFRWFETVEVPLTPEARTTEDGHYLPQNMTVQRVKEQHTKNTSAVVLNYDVLRELTGVDFERKDPPPTPPVEGGEGWRGGNK